MTGAVPRVPPALQVLLPLLPLLLPLLPLLLPLLPLLLPLLPRLLPLLLLLLPLLPLLLPLLPCCHAACPFHQWGHPRGPVWHTSKRYFMSGSHPQCSLIPLAACGVSSCVSHVHDRCGGLFSVWHLYL
jgi:hypothetical protein